MPSAEAKIEDSARNSVGRINFDDHPASIPSCRTAEGFRLTLPAQVILPWPDNDQALSVVRNLRCRISAITKVGNVELGTAVDNGIYHPAKPHSNESASFDWAGGLESLAFYEKLRNGGVAFFQLDVQGEHCYGLAVKNEKWRFTTEPYTFHDNLQLRLPAETWSQMLENLKVAANIHLAVPLPAEPPTGWNKVWGHVLDARSGIRQGGSSGLKACASAVREALTEWQKIEKEDLGGWQPPSLQQRQTMALRERIDFLRWIVREIAHLGPHGTATVWTRDEVMLLYANLCALLAARRP